MKLHVSLDWTGSTAAGFRQLGISIPWPASELLTIQCPEPPLTIEDVAVWIEARVEGLYYRLVQGKDKGQAQVISICPRAGGELPWGDHVDQHLKEGDTIFVRCELASPAMAGAMQPEFTDEDLAKIRAGLRFQLNDRVLCFIGPRWISGHVVGTAVPQDSDVLPYLVKTDPVPGLASRTISVPMDSDQICTQEICFDPSAQLHLVQAAAQVVKESARAKLRFAVGDRVAVRLRNSKEDGLESWAPGRVSAVWPKIGGARTWRHGEDSGEFPDAVPYRVDLDGGAWVYCHRDHFTLVRREGLQPRTRCRGTSKRMEEVRSADGSVEKVDHQTERRKRIASSGPGSDDSE